MSIRPALYRALGEILNLRENQSTPLTPCLCSPAAGQRPPTRIEDYRHSIERGFWLLRSQIAELGESCEINAVGLAVFCARIVEPLGGLQRPESERDSNAGQADELRRQRQERL